MAESTENEFSEYRYISSQEAWVEFPIDHTANSFINHLHCSGQLKGNLASLQAKERLQRISCDGKPRIHDHIYENKIRRQHEAATKPYSFFWEVSDLLSALVIACSELPKANGEELSKRAFELLASMMSTKTKEEIMEFPTAIILTNPTVQRMMILQFEADIRKRLDAIWELSHTPQTKNLGATTVTVLRKLDDILIYLRDAGESDSNYCQSSSYNGGNNDEHSYVQRIEELYFQLMRIRDSLRMDVTAFTTSHENGILFRLRQTTENNKIITDLERILQDYHRGNQGERQKQFRKTYLRFVEAYLPQGDVIKEALRFFSSYQELANYVHHVSTVEEFSDQSRDALYRFIKELFDGPEKVDQAQKDKFDQVFTHAQDAFAYSRLSAVYSEIWMVLDAPLRLLDQEKVIESLALCQGAPVRDMATEIIRIMKLGQLNELINRYVIQMIISIREIRADLAKQYPQLEPLHNVQSDSAQIFVDLFNEKCPKVYGVKPIDLERIDRIIKYAQYDMNQICANQLWVMTAQADALRMECQIIAVNMVDQAVEKLKREHNILREYH